MRILFFICLVLIADSTYGQSNDEVYYKIKTREFGFNTTAFFQNYINIGDIDRITNVKGITFKSVNQKRNTFRSSFGASFSDEAGPNFFFLAMGYERRLKPFKNFTPYWGFEMFANTSDRNNIPDTNIGRGFGFGPVFGINYDFNDRLSLGTESAMYVTLDREADFDFVPPIDLFLNVKFHKKVIRKRNIKYF